MGYIPNYSHLIGIMIIHHWAKGYTIFRQTHISSRFDRSRGHSSSGTGKSAQSEVVATPAAGPLVTAATMSLMSAVQSAWQREIAGAAMAVPLKKGMEFRDQQQMPQIWS